MGVTLPRAWLLLSVFFMSSRLVVGTTFYVDNSGSPPCSNSSANGSAANPWCTVAYGVGRISTGDTLYVKNGTYNEAFTISRPAGSAGAHTIISAYPGHTPILRGTGVSGGRMKITGTSYIDFSGFIITNNNQGLYVTDDEGTNTPPHHIWVTGVTVHDTGQEGIAIKGGVSFITLTGCTVYNTGLLGTGSNGEGIYVGGSAQPDNTNNITIKNCTVHDTQDEGIEIKPGTHDCVVDGDTLYNALSPGSSYSSGGGAIEIDNPNGNYGSNPNHLVRNNIIHDIGFTSGITKYGIRIGTGATVYNNIVYNINGSYKAIYSNEADYARLLYHNTVDAPSSTAVVNSGTNLDSRNNIGPSTTNNSPISASFFVNYAAHDYRLVAGAAVVNAGVDLRSVVPIDIVGRARDASPDRGAYEFASVASPAPPTNLHIVP